MEVSEPVSVRCSALIARGKTLLLCHRHRDDVWVLPGGSPHRSESASKCAEREVHQETGIQIRAMDVAFVLDATSPKGEQHLFEIVFATEEDDSSSEPGGYEEELVPGFVPLDEVARLRVLPRIGTELQAFVVKWSSPKTVPATARYLDHLWEAPLRSHR